MSTDNKDSAYEVVLKQEHKLFTSNPDNFYRWISYARTTGVFFRNYHEQVVYLNEWLKDQNISL